MAEPLQLPGAVEPLPLGARATPNPDYTRFIPRTRSPSAMAILRNSPFSYSADTPLPPPRPPHFGINEPLNPPSSPAVTPPQEPGAPARGGGSVWDALLSLFSGQQNAPTGQGMTGLIPPRGTGGMGTDALGNPTNRFG